jgi:hypothetical protein
MKEEPGAWATFPVTPASHYETTANFHIQFHQILVEQLLKALFLALGIGRWKKRHPYA